MPYYIFAPSYSATWGKKAQLTTKGENDGGGDLCDYSSWAIIYTLHYLRLSHKLVITNI